MNTKPCRSAFEFSNRRQLKQAKYYDWIRWKERLGNVPRLLICSPFPANCLLVPPANTCYAIHDTTKITDEPGHLLPLVALEEKVRSVGENVTSRSTAYISSVFPVNFSQNVQESDEKNAPIQATRKLNTFRRFIEYLEREKMSRARQRDWTKSHWKDARQKTAAAADGDDDDKEEEEDFGDYLSDLC